MKTERLIKVGDTVRLKSGSTDMSVDAIRPSGRVVCVWFDGDYNIYRATFAVEALKIM